ncbi:MAG: hypothetical protein HY770_06190 [Chitinivibrionia bacterium]|nr:hypothetical protein [Chitinivibrionia bacterium]
MSRAKRYAILMSLAVIVAGLSVSGAGAMGQKRGIGIIPVGFSINPDQYVLGLQAEFDEMYKTRFAPSVDVGFGDDVTLVSFNLDLKVDLFSPPNSGSTLYAGAGGTIAYIDPKNFDSDTEIGMSLLGGIKLGMGEKNYYSIEARYGIGDIADFKLLGGVMFGFGGAE